MGAVNDPVTEVRFWTQVTTDAKRTIACSAANEHRYKTYIAENGLDGLFTVVVSPVVDDDHVIVLDEHANEATFRESMQRWRHEEWRP